MNWRRKPKGQTNFVVGPSVSQKNILPNAREKKYFKAQINIVLGMMTIINVPAKLSPNAWE